MKVDLPQGGRVICAVSGGADSMALLHLLVSNHPNVVAAHFNHRLRDDESDRDERFVRNYCDQHGIELIVGSADVRTYAEANSLSIEEAARHLRYEFLFSLEGDTIAVAHNAQDNAETIVQHMLRGSGMRGLCGIPPSRGKLVRPLLRVTRQEIEAYVKEHGIPYVHDSSNDSLAYQRNRIRHEILPRLLCENPNFLHTASAQSEILRAEDALLDEYAHELLDRAKVADAYSCETILSAPEALQRRALRLLADVSYGHILQMQALLKHPSPSARISLPMGLCMQRQYDLFLIRAQAPTPTFEEFHLDLNQNEVFLPSGWKISWCITENLQLFKNSPFHFALKCDMISQHGLLLRPRQSGDALTLSCRKSVKKWMIEKKLPSQMRDALAVFVCGDRIAAVAGLGADRAFSAVSGEKAFVFSVDPLTI